MAAYALTIFTGAFLLFQLQPLIGKYILPWFGGSPAVWTICMLFFQMLLLGGYLYAHLLTRYFRPARQAFIHVCLLLTVLAFLPITPADDWKPLPGNDPTVRILWLLTVCVGLPYFALSATGPLLQRWFSLMHPGRSPYRLYALSNLGSLLALVSYPFVFEPALTRRAQAEFWSWGMLGFAVVCGFCALRLRRQNAPLEAATLDAAEAAEPISARRRLLWLLLPACASALLLATTNKMCQDVAVVPFLWVLPLSLYLLSFIISFDNPRWYSRLWFGPALLLALGGVCYILIQGSDVPLWGQISGFSAVLFVLCMVCHGELYRLKPPPQRLTGFYVMIAAGGALGGLFIALIAPMMFDNYFEFHLLLLVTSLTVLAVFFGDIAAVCHRVRFGGTWALMTVGTLLLGAFLGLGAALVYDVRDARADAIASARNFYGVLIVHEYHKDDPEAQNRVLLHGRITHGLQFTDPVASRWLTTYYGDQSGVGLALEHFPRATARRIGVVGLGVGTLAAYGREGDYLRIYEINPDVERFAREHFTYLSESPAKTEVILGDARLSMEREPPQEFDVLVLDAFSSDAIPVHLLTRESFAIYRRHLKPDGIIAVHISNRHLDLRPVVLALSRHIDLQSVVIEDSDEPDWWLYASTWVLLTNNEEFLGHEAVLLAMLEPEEDLAAVRLWTDDYTALFKVLD